MQTTEESDYFMREPEVKRITGLSRTTRWRLERDGKFPRKRQLSENVKANVASEIKAWVPSDRPRGWLHGPGPERLQLSPVAR